VYAEAYVNGVSRMRRKDREMPRAFAEAVVDTCTFAVLATVNEDGSPYCIPLSIVREGEWIYFHCAKEGQKLDNLKRQNQVCMSCVGHTHIPEGKFTIEYASAVVFGTAEELVSDAEKIYGLRLLCKRYTPENMQAFEQAIANALHITGVWKVHIDRISGKQRKPE
jgi:nitroimidazol reductase NimA-like FMN-containing flavoprotein (pyridoxamine 5'-phosphate oxidase superfamily)